MEANGIRLHSRKTTAIRTRDTHWPGLASIMVPWFMEGDRHPGVASAFGACGAEAIVAAAIACDCLWWCDAVPHLGASVVESIARVPAWHSVFGMLSFNVDRTRGPRCFPEVVSASHAAEQTLAI